MPPRKAKDTSLSSKIIERLDIVTLADAVVDELAERVASSLATSTIVDRLFESRKEEFQTQMTELILEKLQQ